MGSSRGVSAEAVSCVRKDALQSHERGIEKEETGDREMGFCRG